MLKNFVEDFARSIEIVDKKYSLIHFIEEKENRYLRWKSKDHYWVDPEDGFVWKSIQNIAPNIPPIVIEVTKKPALGGLLNGGGGEI